jgi:hypothetical protein
MVMKVDPMALHDFVPTAGDCRIKQPERDKRASHHD